MQRHKGIETLREPIDRKKERHSPNHTPNPKHKEQPCWKYAIPSQ